jgi:magnesium transporter
MPSDVYSEPWLTLAALVRSGDAKQLSRFVDALSPAETARAVSRLDEETRGTLLLLLTPGEAAEVLHEIPDSQAADLIEDIRPEAAAAIMDQMPSDEQADILADVDAHDAEAILKAMPSKRASATRKLLAYPEDTAGGIMTTEYLCYREEMTVAEILEDLHIHNQEYSDYEVQYAYIVSKRGLLRGVLLMRDLLLSARGKKVGSIMIANPVHVLDSTPLEDLIQLFDQHTYLGVPVTDKAGHLLGIVRRGQVMEASGHRAEKSFLQVSGIVGGEEFRSMPLLNRSFRRLSWLSINIFLNIIAASVIAFYQDTLSAVIALAVFLPIISDMSGCSGNQAVAVSIRELTLG